MNAKTSSEGEEEASGTRNEALGESGYLGEAKRRQVIRVAYVIAALDLTFLFMQMGIMPYLAKSLGLDSVGFGYLQTIFGVLQLVGGYIFGRFADQFGARAALILSSASGSVFFLLMSLSTSIPVLFLSRLPGVFMHGIPGAQKVITDVTTPSERAGTLGKLGLCFGVGIIAGSALGGVLSTKLGGCSPCILRRAASARCSCLAAQQPVPADLGLLFGPMAGLGKAACLPAAPVFLREDLCVPLEGRQEFLLTRDELSRAGRARLSTPMHREG